jgi:hypothetical protein
MAYTYLIGWSKTNKWYYGVRYAEKSTNDDLWKTYFTSSDYVKRYREEFGEPDVIEIRRVFNDPKIAIRCEDRVIRKLRLHENDDFLNKSYSGSIFYDQEVREKISNHAKKPRTEVFKEARSQTMKRLWQTGVYDNRPPQTEEHKRKNSDGLKKRYQIFEHHSKGKPQKEYANEKRSKTLLKNNAALSKEERKKKFGHPGKLNCMHGKKHNDETKQKIKNSALNRPTLECENCGETITFQTYGRYHKNGKCQ